MTNWRQLLGNERGTALALALIILVIMTGLAVGLATMGGVESRISAGQSAGSRARLLAESGVEYAFLKLAGGGFNVPLLAGSVLIPAGTTLPGLTAASGTFGVTVRNDTTVGDTLLTGAATIDVAPGTATNDINGVLVLTSTGTVDGATRVLVAVVQRGVLPLNAAMTLPGDQADTTTDSPCEDQSSNCANPQRTYSIDGRDWLRTDTNTPTGTNPRKLGIATATNATESTVENAFSNNDRRKFVQGRDETSGTGAWTDGLNTIDSDGTLTEAIIGKFLANLAANPATQIIQSTQACAFGTSGIHDKPEGLRMTSTAAPGVVTVKNNCNAASGKQIDQTINLGTPTSPQMIYFKGEFDPSSNFTGVGVDGAQAIQGYGLLVVEDADLAFFQTGQFRWDGIVLVTGRNVAVAFKGDSNTEIRGALIGNETNPAEAGGFFEFFNRTRDTMIIRASQQNVDMALRALYNMRITSVRETCNLPPC